MTAGPGPARAGLRRHRNLVAALLALAGLLLTLHLLVEALLHQADSAAERQALARVTLRAEAAAQLMQRYLEGFESYFELLQYRNVAVATGDPAASGVEGRLAMLTQTHRFGVIQAGTIDPDGITRWSSLTGAVELNLADRPHFVAHLRAGSGIYVSEPLVGRVSGQWSIQFSRRITNAAGGFAGVGVLSVDPAVLGGQLASLSAGRTETLALYRDDGRLLARSRNGVVASPADNPPADMPAPPSPEAQRMRAPGESEDRFVAHIPISGLPIYVGVGTPVQVELAEAARLRQWIRLTEAALALIVLGSAVLALAFVTRQRDRQRVAAAQARQAELTRVLDGIDGAVFLSRLHPDGRNTRDYMSAGAARLTRLAAGSLYSDDHVLRHLEPPLTPAQLVANYAHLLQTGRHVDEGRLRCADGSLRWIRVAVSVIGRQGEALELAGLITDIDTEKSAEAAAMSNARLATLGEMASGLAHEMNQPLAVIALTADTAALLTERDPVANRPQVLETLRRISAMTMRGRAIIDHLRLFARQQDGRQEAVSVPDAVAGALLLTGGTLRDSGVELEQHLPAGLPLVRGQRVLLEQVLMNLFINAAHAMAGTAAGQRRLRLAASATADGVCLQVTDSGTGLAPEVQARLFDPFFTTKPPGQGTGLGLSICHGIIKASGGDISAANAPGSGACFTLRLRRAEPEDAMAAG